MAKSSKIRCLECGQSTIPQVVIDAEGKWKCPDCHKTTDASSVGFKAALLKLKLAARKRRPYESTAIKLQGKCSRCGASAGETDKKCHLCGSIFK